MCLEPSNKAVSPRFVRYEAAVPSSGRATSIVRFFRHCIPGNLTLASGWVSDAVVKDQNLSVLWSLAFSMEEKISVCRRFLYKNGANQISGGGMPSDR